MQKKLSYLLIFILLIHIILIIVTSTTPPISRDAIIHHLAIPKLYLQHGSIYEIPDIEFSYYPQLIDLLYSIPLWLGHDILAKYIHFFFALLTAILIYVYLKKEVSRTWALFGSLFFLSIPVIIKLSVNVYIDLGLIFFSTASLLSIITWLKTEKIKWFWISGIACGLTLSSKYTGLITLLILALVIPFYYIKGRQITAYKQIKALSFSGLFILVALIIFSPWLIKNTLWTGNPVYPLYDKYFSETPRQTGLVKDKEKIVRNIGHLQTRKILYQEAWWETWSIPIRVFFQGQDDNPQYFDGKLNPFLLLLPFLLLIRKKNNKRLFDNQIMIVFSALFIIIVFFKTDMRVRYIAPALPALVILSTKGLYNLHLFLTKRYSRRIADNLAILFSVLSLIPNYYYAYSLYHRIDPMSYLSSQLTREQYLDKHLPDYATISYINKNIPEDSKILAVHLRYRSYYFKRQVVFSNSIFKSAILHSENAFEIHNLLKTQNFTYLLIRMDLFMDWLKYQPISTKKKVMLFFNNYTKQQYNKNTYTLFKL